MSIILCLVIWLVICIIVNVYVPNATVQDNAWWVTALGLGAAAYFY